MTQRAEGICVKKNGHAKSYQTVCSGGKRGGQGRGGRSGWEGGLFTAAE